MVFDRRGSNPLGVVCNVGYWRNWKRASLARTRYWDRNPDTPVELRIIPETFCLEALTRVGWWLCIFVAQIAAPVAQLAAGGSHNPKVASSILARSIFFFALLLLLLDSFAFFLAVAKKGRAARTRSKDVAAYALGVSRTPGCPRGPRGLT